MYLDFLVNIPNSPGKITYRRKNGVDYVYYEYDRIYDKNTQKTNPKRATIGKKSEADPTKMQPNENYLKYFPDEDVPETISRTARSGCLRIGSWLVIRKIIKEYGLEEILSKYINRKDLGLVLDLAAYSIITENNAGQYYPDYAYNHPLFSGGMRIYSDSKVSDLLQSMTEDQSVGFLNEWNAACDHREKIYISYDSTNKYCQASDIEIVESGASEEETGMPDFLYALAFDKENKVPLFYERYPAGISDVTKLRIIADKAAEHGYKKLGFILDRGYFSRENISAMDKRGYSFVIMVKGMNDLVSAIVTGVKGTFENKRAKYCGSYDVYGTTVKRTLFETDAKERYFHIYCNASRQSSLDGYFCIITSERMTAGEALDLYMSRDNSEKLFRGDKSYLGADSLEIYDDESWLWDENLGMNGDDAVDAKIFIEFIALIIRNKIYDCLKKEAKRVNGRSGHITVPAAIRELEKIEMVRHTDNTYRLDHAVTATQKMILKEFDIDANLVKSYAAEISKTLKYQ